MKGPLLLGGLAIVVAGGLYVLTRDDTSHTAPEAARSAKIEGDVREPGAPSVAPKPAKQMVMTESGPRELAGHAPRQWLDPRNGALNREIVDAVPDPVAEAKTDLTYRKSRLRLELMAEAEQCWTGGGDTNEGIELEYSLVVRNENLVTEDVRIKHTDIKDPAVQQCIVNAARDMSTLAAGVPDMTERKSLLISTKDLHAGRLKRERQDAAKANDDTTTGADRAPAKFPER